MGHSGNLQVPLLDKGNVMPFSSPWQELTGVAGQGASRVASVPLSCDRPQERQLRVLQLMAVLLCESHVATFFTDVSQVR